MKNNDSIQNQQPVPDPIVRFLNEHHVLTLATTVNDLPHCCNCFYVFQPATARFIFASDFKTKHIQQVLINSQVSGTVTLETKIVGKIQGIQFAGTMQQVNVELHKDATNLYLKRFPYALALNPVLWVIDLNFLKFTDNRLGFGKKLIWPLPE